MIRNFVILLNLTNVLGAFGMQWGGYVRPLRDMGESIGIKCESTMGGGADKSSSL
jgi:hypothetical protein